MADFGMFAHNGGSGAWRKSGGKTFEWDAIYSRQNRVLRQDTRILARWVSLGVGYIEEGTIFRPLPGIFDIVPLLTSPAEDVI